MIVERVEGGGREEGVIEWVLSVWKWDEKVEWKYNNGTVLSISTIKVIN